MPEEAEWDRRFELLKKAVDEHPDDGMAWSDFGDFLYYESDNPNLAVRAYERARELLPNTDLRLRLGSAYVSNGETEKGFAMMQASAEEHPRAEAYCFLSDAYFRNNQETEAEQAARRAIRIEPTFEEGYYLLGESLKNRDKESAIDAYRSAISHDQDYALAWQALGRELVRSNNDREAIDALKRAVDLDPENMWSHVYLANALWKAGQSHNANAQYLAAISLAPEFADLRKWYNKFLADYEPSNKS